MVRCEAVATIATAIKDSAMAGGVWTIWTGACDQNMLAFRSARRAYVRDRDLEQALMKVDHQGV
ncbi:MULTISPECIES: hypothetical protein [Ochrobactrum]|uniref:hypothetical protein n=1 Tax=Ochrobactrum TaxID=528 RepID=UPI00177BC93C|nr:hypothetical protein [Ochrobactrum sp. AN78]MBD7993227.1 hypothetical protein [Ochrobactrum gallinarum]MDH7793636.1 hypothetical protein [Ochrobactrum sp. AN78]